MTCVAGVIKNGIVTMGCDLLVTSSDGDVMSKNKKKIFRVGPCLIGFCGPARVAELLQYKLDLSKYWTLSGYQYVCKELVPKLRELLQSEGLEREEAGVISTDVEFLVACKGSLFSICNAYSVSDLGEYNAIGAGRSYALGALCALYRLSSNYFSKDIIHEALSVASEFSTSCGNKFQIEEL